MYTHHSFLPKTRHKRSFVSTTNSPNKDAQKISHIFMPFGSLKILKQVFYSQAVFLKLRWSFHLFPKLSRPHDLVSRSVSWILFCSSAAWAARHGHRSLPCFSSSIPNHAGHVHRSRWLRLFSKDSEIIFFQSWSSCWKTLDWLYIVALWLPNTEHMGIWMPTSPWVLTSG